MISGAKKRIPKRRFKEFLNAGAWEQRKLGDITKANPFKSYISNTLEIGEYEVIQQGEVPIAGYADGSPCYNYENITIFGDHTLSLFKPNKPFFIASDGVKLLSPLVKIDGQFFYYLLEKYKPKSEGYKRHFTILKNCEAYFPNNIEEQTKISTLLNRMNSIITLHQRKLDKLQATKKALLQEMFPEEGQDKPKRRFKGFTDAWEQRKLGEIFEYLQNNTLSRDSLNYKNPNIKNIHYGDILVKFDEILDGSNKDIPYINSELDLSKFSKSLLRDGDIIFSDTAEDDTVGKAIELQNVNAPFILGGLHTIPCRPLIPFGKGYLGNFLNSDSYRLQLRPLVQGIKVSSISKSALKDTMIEYPKNLDEQEKIGSLFYYIAKLITLHQRKLDKLKNLKQAYLNEMFV